MRPGPLEIVIILAVIVAIIILARIFRASPAPGGEKTAAETTAGSAWGTIRKVGVALIILGIVYFVGAIGVFEMLGWAIRSYLWALPAIIIGILCVMLPRGK